MLQLALALPLFLSAPALPPTPQGAVWVVDANAGPGHDFVYIHEAVNAAADGDTVLVRAGGYAPFPFSGKSLSVLAEAGAQVDVYTFSGFGFLMDISGTPAGSTTVVRGIDFVANQVGPSTFAFYCMKLVGCAGTVWFEDCIFEEGPNAPVVIEGCADVVLERCSAFGTKGWVSPQGSKSSSPALRASGSRVTIHGGEYAGGEGKNGGLTSGFGSTGQPGIHMLSGELYLAACSVIGGGGGSGGSGSTCPSMPPDGGPGLLAVNGVVRTLGADLVGGAAGTAWFGCTDAVDGEPFRLGTAVLTQLAGTPSSLTSNSPVREGQTLTLSLATTTGQPLTALVMAGQATDPLFSGPLQGVNLLGGPTRRIQLGTVDPLTGIATFQLAIPDLGPGVLVEPWIFQAYVCGSGGCTAGAATHTVWLDSSL